MLWSQLVTSREEGGVYVVAKGKGEYVKVEEVGADKEYGGEGD